MMVNLNKILKYSIMPLVETWKYGQEEIRHALDLRYELERLLKPRSLSDILMMPVRLKMAAAPFAIVCMLYAGAFIGCGKIAAYAYENVKSEIKYQMTLQSFSDVHNNMNLPPEYGA